MKLPDAFRGKVETPTGAPQDNWLRTLRRYVVVVAVMNLVWEFAHLPLYTIWESAPVDDIVFAAVHCTGGDVLSALSSVMLVLFLGGNPAWPGTSYRRVAVLTVIAGMTYTLFSEWLNVKVLGAWAYRDAMPLIPVVDIGASPILQWLVIPSVAFWWTAQSAESRESFSPYSSDGIPRLRRTRRGDGIGVLRSPWTVSRFDWKYTSRIQDRKAPKRPSRRPATSGLALCSTSPERR